jgi:hypothetical protein
MCPGALLAEHGLMRLAPAVPILRFGTITTIALLMGLFLAHVLEMPAKLDMQGSEYVFQQTHLYGFFGDAGAVLEPLALLGSLGLAAASRRGRVAALVAAACTVGMLLAFALGNQPANLAFSQAGATPPDDWQDLRVRWEASHAASGVLASIAFTSLLVSALRTPGPGTASSNREGRASRPRDAPSPRVKR